MSSAEEPLQEETRRVMQALETLLGRSSQWSGRVTLTESAEVRGRKPFSCDIVLNASLAGQAVRWRTIIHEALHSFSAGYNFTDYQLYRGWEEGMVESLQRLLRQRVLAQIGVFISDAENSQIEAAHDYTEFIAALESMRAYLGDEAVPYYQRLLETPIQERPASLLRRGWLLPAAERAQYIAVFSAADAALKKGQPRWTQP